MKYFLWVQSCQKLVNSRAIRLSCIYVSFKLEVFSYQSTKKINEFLRGIQFLDKYSYEGKNESIRFYGYSKETKKNKTNRKVYQF